jgi:tRNA wybutosine-synthesizing protein 5
LESLVFSNNNVDCCTGEVLFIPALWFHNVHALEPCVSVNIFWKHLSEDMYEKKDLYGNKDLVPAAKALKQAEEITASLAQVPEYYRYFYAKMLIQNIKSALDM